MGRLTVKRLLTFCLGATIFAGGALFLYRIYDTGTGIFISTLPFFGLFVGGSLVVDSLQGRYEFGKISSVAFAIASVPLIGIGLYAVAVSVRNPHETFAGLFSTIGIGLTCVGVVLLFAANRKIGLRSKVAGTLQ